jgi:hypothetical protein
MQLSLELFTFLCTWIAAPGVIKICGTIDVSALW